MLKGKEVSVDLERGDSERSRQSLKVQALIGKRKIRNKESKTMAA